jgi:hypothetical protein
LAPIAGIARTGVLALHGVAAWISGPVSDCREAGDPIDEFLEDFPSVSREQTVAVMRRWPVSR